jgi:NAD(P)H-dependent flavin oxidoreductase YrpB (nitropropane dioxygenase family)
VVDAVDVPVIAAGGAGDGSVAGLIVRVVLI